MSTLTLKNRNYRIRKIADRHFEVSYYSLSKKTGKEFGGIRFIPVDRDNAKWIPFVSCNVETARRGYETLEEAIFAIRSHAA